MSQIIPLVAEIASRYNLRQRNGRYVGPCPDCGGTKGSDKFQIRDDGGYKCYGCDLKGDIITWLRSRDSKSCPDAHDLAGLPCRSASCQYKGTCRHGDGSGRPAPRRNLQPLPAPAIKTLPTASISNPQETWQHWASQLVDQATAALAGSPDLIAWLGRRGISPAAIDRFRLGWLDHDRRVLRQSIGLPPKAKNRLWVPGGLVIPTLTADGSVHRLRIRRPETAREKFLPDLKYVWIEGSGNAPMSLQPLSGKARAAVIVEAELDAMAVAASHEGVMAIALGTVRAGIDQTIRRLLADCPVILVSLDADPGGEQHRPGAGPAAIATWLNEYRQARYWPTPVGKDPGEYAQQGGDLHAWLEAGLPPVLKSVPPPQDLALSADCSHSGGEGGALPPVSQSLVMTLLDGRVIYVTEEQEEWSRLVLEGKIVFSANEMHRLQTACRGMDKEERAQAALQAVDIKQIFTGAYIRRGVQL